MEQIKNVYLTASNSERKNNLVLAYKQYLFCIKEAMTFLSRNSFQPGQQQTCQMYFAVIEKCTERIKFLYPKVAPKGSRTNVHLQPQNYPTTKSARKTLPSSTSQPNNPVYGTEPPQRSSLPNQSQTGRSRLSTGKPKEDGDDLRASLRAKMREYESKGIGIMTEESVLKRQFQLQERTDREMNKQAAKVRKSFRNSFYGGSSRWKRDNQWANFIQKNFHYVKMNNDMLLKDKSFIDMIGNTPTSVLFPHVQPKSKNQEFVQPTKSGSSYALPTLSSVEDERKRTVTEEIEVFVEKYLLFDPSTASSTQSSLIGVHQPRKHQLLVLIDRFIAYLRDTYFIPRKISKQDLNVSNLREDVRSFTDCIVGFLLGKLWRVSDDLCQNVLSEKLINGIYRVIFRYIQNFYITIDCRIVMKHKAVQYHRSPSEKQLEIFLQKYRKNDTFNEKIRTFVQHFNIAPFGQQKTPCKFNLKHLRMKKKYRLERLQEPYIEVIRMFQEFSTVGFIVDKLELTQRCLKQVSKCVNSYYKQYHPEKQPEDYPPVGAEELLPIFVYCLIKSRSFDMMFVFYYIEAFLTDDLIRGIMGYSLATLETSLSYIWERLTYEEMLESEKYLNDKEGPSAPTPPAGGGGGFRMQKFPQQYPRIQQQPTPPHHQQQPAGVYYPQASQNVKPVSYNQQFTGRGMNQQHQHVLSTQQQRSDQNPNLGNYKVPQSYDTIGDDQLDALTKRLGNLKDLSSKRQPNQPASRGPAPPKTQKKTDKDEEVFLDMSSTLDGLLDNL